MQKLSAQLNRLYLPENALPPEALGRHMAGETNLPVSLASSGQVRAIAIAFDKRDGDDEAQHWKRLCLVANALQTELDLPAPAVSISSTRGFRLWLSFAAPIPAALAQQFLGLLRDAYFPDVALPADAATAAVELPPCLHADSGRWAAFINPGLGASFADEAGLEMAPPLAGQAALLENLKSISQAQLQHAMQLLQRSPDAIPVIAEPPVQAAAAGGVLLKDATLEQIVAHLHSLNIEPTLRHLIRGH